mgnify:CR=1 FL=1
MFSPEEFKKAENGKLYSYVSWDDFGGFYCDVVYEIINEEHIEDTSIDIDNDEVSIDFLLTIIQKLPDRYRMVFNLYALDGYSHKEIAAMLDITTGTTKSNLARARMILKDKIITYKARLNSQLL